MDSEHELRTQAVHRLKSRHAFWRTAFTFLVVAGLLVVVWLLSGMGYFWPIWPFVGMGIGAIFIGINTYSHSGAITDAQVDAEVAKMKKSN